MGAAGGIHDLGRAIESLQNDLVSGPEKSLPNTAALRKDCYFLESAIRSTARDTKALFGSWPFRVFAEYSEISSSHSAAEALLAEANRLIDECDNSDQ